VGLVYDPRELLGVTTARPGVDGVLQYKNMTVKSKIAVKKIPPRTGLLYQPT
jgi:hypothetical protein